MPCVWRIAVASTDGKVVNTHFGKASVFLIVDIGNGGSYQYIGSRSVTPLCGIGGHMDDALHKVIETLHDCSGVLVARIGPEIKNILEAKRISVFELPLDIEEALAQVYNYFSRMLPSDA